jgi:hypothetical protein
MVVWVVLVTMVRQTSDSHFKTERIAADEAAIQNKPSSNQPI